MIERYIFYLTVREAGIDLTGVIFYLIVREAGIDFSPSLAYVHSHTHENARGKPLGHPDRAFTQHAA